MTPRRHGGQIAVALLAALALNFPVLAVVDAVRAGDRPATPAYLFVAWLGVIAVGALVNLRAKH